MRVRFVLNGVTLEKLTTLKESILKELVLKKQLIRFNNKDQDQFDTIDSINSNYVNQNRLSK